MWIASRYGFFSITCPTYPDFRLQTDVLQMRTRNRDHLVALKKHFGLTQDIVHTPEADYQFRIVVPKEIGVRVIREMAEEIDYSNFKNEAHSSRPGDGGFNEFLGKVWALGARWLPISDSARKRR